MASRKAHCLETFGKLGKEWECVHAWLDGLACVNGMLNIRHRRWRHHKDGVEEVRKIWGDEAAEAAEIHIKRDLGWIPTKAQAERRWPEEPKLISFDELGGKQ